MMLMLILLRNQNFFMKKVDKNDELHVFSSLTSEYWEISSI